MPTTVPSLPAVLPNRTQDQQTFDSAMASFVSNLPAVITGMNTAVDQVNAGAGDAAAAAGTAVTASETATGKAAEAAEFAASAVNAPGTNGTSTSSLTIPTSTPAMISFTTQPNKEFAPNQFVTLGSTASPGNLIHGYLTAYTKATGAATMVALFVRGVGTFNAWTVALSAPMLATLDNAVVAKSAAYTAVKSDHGRILECTNSWTLTLPLPTAVPNGWYLYVRHGSSGGITLSGTVNGASGVTVAGGTAIVYSDGTAMKAIMIPGLGYAKFSDQKASGTQGGSAVAATITQTRTLNTTEANTIPGASLSSNSITLPAGTYDIRARAPAAQVGAHQLFLYNSTDAVYALFGSSAFTNTASVYTTDSMLGGRITISAPKTFSLRHRTQGAMSGYGLGQTAASGQTEVYAEIEIWRIA